jgi:hypothetical protein
LIKRKREIPEKYMEKFIFLTAFFSVMGCLVLFMSVVLPMLLPIDPPVHSIHRAEPRVTERTPAAE